MSVLSQVLRSRFEISAGDDYRYLTLGVGFDRNVVGRLEPHSDYCLHKGDGSVELTFSISRLRNPTGDDLVDEVFSEISDPAP